MLKTIVIPHHNDYVLTLPNEYLNRQIEILVFPVDSNDSDQEAPQPLRLTKLERDHGQDSVDIDQLDEDQEFWETFGSWQDQRPIEKIIADIYESRTTTERHVQL
jgi:hypothetical protein